MTTHLEDNVHVFAGEQIDLTLMSNVEKKKSHILSFVYLLIFSNNLILVRVSGFRWIIIHCSRVYSFTLQHVYEMLQKSVLHGVQHDLATE